MRNMGREISDTCDRGRYANVPVTAFYSIALWIKRKFEVCKVPLEVKSSQAYCMCKIRLAICGKTH